MGSSETGAVAEIDQARLDEFLGRAVNDMGAAMSGLLVVMGDRLGLYKAMAGAGPMTSTTLAKKTGTAERQVREWLNAQATCGYVTYQDAASQTYTLPVEQAFCFRRYEDSPAFLPRLLELAMACYKNESKITDAFRSGKGTYRLARAPSGSLRGDVSVLPPRLQREPRRRPGSRRSTASTRG